MINDLKSTVGNRVKTLRTAQHITQEVLASMIERTPETVSSIERGKFQPNLETLERISRALRIPLSSFSEEDKQKADHFVRSWEIEFRLRKALEPLSGEDIDTALALLETFSERQQKK